MHVERHLLRLSATDLAHHLACRHRTTLDRAAAEGRLEAPVRRDPRLDALKLRGAEHERAYLDHLRAQGLTVLDLLDTGDLDDAEPARERTRRAMASGADVIFQASLSEGKWIGRADVLLKVNSPSRLGPFGYEVVDTKLTRTTRAGTLLQLAVYTDLVARLQDRLPEAMHVVTPGTDFRRETHRARDFMAYFRLVRRRLEAMQAAEDPYPEPVLHCDVCRWWSRCDRRRRSDDHLGFVAGISTLEIQELRARGIGTLEALGSAPIPFPWKPSRGSASRYTRVREQARIQLEGRRRGEACFELLPPEPDQGLARLPPPSDADIFFDIEGDPFVAPDGLEYLLGWVVRDGEDWTCHRLEALDPHQERRAFEEFVDMVLDRWARHPDLHIYHYAPYEPSALKRLMSRHATREEAVDRMLRAGLFVDLYAIVRRALRASVESYSIKNLEVFFGYARDADLRDASAALQAVEVALELGDPGSIDPGALEAVRIYNADDCRATRGLRNWLETLRHEAIGTGLEIPRPVAAEATTPESVGAWLETIRPIREALLDGIPQTGRDSAAGARYLIAHMLDFFRREDNVAWWTYFRLRDLSGEQLIDERAALAGLSFVERLEVKRNAPTDRYRFPAQNTNIRAGKTLTLPDETRFGTVESIDFGQRTVDIRKPRAQGELHPTAVFSSEVIPGQRKAPALVRMAEWILDHGIDADGPFQAGRDLLLRRPPRFRVGTAWPAAGDANLVETACTLVNRLDRSVLAIQGPPGAGKTYTAAQMAVALLGTGKTVGVTAVSHKVVGHLLGWIQQIAAERGVGARCLQKVSHRPTEPNPTLPYALSNDDIVEALAARAANVIGGTAWLWTREDMAEAVDVLFVDEAGQLALADAVAASQGAQSIVLLGDPSQLDQPLQGSHPEGTGVSALEHLLDGHLTMPPERGLFIPTTRRLAPAICRFTSEVFYDGRLGAIPELEGQALEGSGPVTGAGLWFLPTPHTGNQSASAEEVGAIRDLYHQLTDGSTHWIDAGGVRSVVGAGDILIVAPYNAQVSDIQQALPDARVGTVDRFQGQEAAVVIYSMTTSTAEDAPHGMEFLYSPNRLNVATSRARCAVILVANPAVFEPECRTPQQMKLANAFCRYLEMAREI